MKSNTAATQNSTATPPEVLCESDSLSQRDVRALVECMAVLNDTPEVRDVPGFVEVVSSSGRSYTVDYEGGSCTCADAEHRDPDGGCKHVRRSRFALGMREIPSWVQTDAIDSHLGEHVRDGPRLVADGGTQTTLDEMDDERPDSCECSAFAVADDNGLPCWSCYQAGHTSPNPDAAADEDGDAR